MQKLFTDKESGDENVGTDIFAQKTCVLTTIELTGTTGPGKPYHLTASTFLPGTLLSLSNVLSSSIHVKEGDPEIENRLP